MAADGHFAQQGFAKCPARHPVSKLALLASTACFDSIFALKGGALNSGEN